MEVRKPWWVVQAERKRCWAWGEQWAGMEDGWSIRRASGGIERRMDVRDKWEEGSGHGRGGARPRELDKLPAWMAVRRSSIVRGSCRCEERRTGRGARRKELWHVEEQTVGRYKEVD